MPKIIHCEFKTEILAIFEDKKMTIINTKTQKHIVESEFLEEAESLMLLSDIENDEFSIFMLVKNSNIFKRIIFDSVEGRIAETNFF